MQKIKEKLAEYLSKELNLPKHEIIIEEPKNQSFGDLSFLSINYAKAIKKNPIEAAEKISKLKKPDFIESINHKGIYVNFKFKREWLLKELLKAPEKKNKKDTVMVEFSQPNTNKAFHIGHLRNCILGQTLVNIMKASGYKVISANYIGDIGTHVAKSLWYIDKFESGIPKRNAADWLSEVYVKATKISDDYKDEIDEVHRKLDANDKKWIELWKKTKNISMKEFERIYKELNVKFDVYFYESEVADEGKKIAYDLLKKGIAKRDDGAILVDLKKYNLGVFLILKSDDTPLYSTKDLALAVKKFNEYKITRSIYVVGSEQEMYFKQLFKTLELMGFENAKKCYHLSYGLVMLKEGKMSSRQGNIITYKEIKNRVFRDAVKEIRKRHKWNEEKIKKTAEKITLSALKFAMISKDPKKTIVFVPEKAVQFEGETGPYLQYVYTRCNSILKKAGSSGKLIIEGLKLDEETALIKHISKFDETINAIAENYQIHLFARYLLDLAQLFNNYYEKHKVIADDEKIKNARLFLITRVMKTIKQGLHLMGIDVIDEM